MSAANPYLDVESAAATRQSRHALRPPRRWLRYLEPRAAIETLALVPTSPLWATRQRGDGRQVLVIPGFMTDDGSTWPLRRYLNFLGYDALPWELGRNKGVPDKDAERLAARLDDVRRQDEKITLIGWSLGGVVARETARLRPDAVREVITMGTPVEGGPKYTIAAQHYAEQRGEDLEAFEQYVHSVNSKGITQPLTVIYSESDGIVGWRAALDRYNPQAKHVRVHGSHLGLGTNPQVWLTIEKTLRLSADTANA